MKQGLPAAALVALAVIGVGCPGARRSEQEPPRRVVLISIDTARADHFGCYGYPRSTTPEIDALAREGARFGRFHTPIPTTEPAHASILTGLHPRVHGMRYNGMPVVIPHLPTLGTWFEKRRYATAAIVSRRGLIPQMMGLDGFQTEIQPEPGDEFTGRETYREFRRWFGRHPRTPFFLWLHFQDPHSPYTPAPEFGIFERPGGPNQEPLLYNYLSPSACASPEAIQRGIARYDGEIRTADHFIGKVARDLVRDLNEGDPPPLLVVTADHGEEMDEVLGTEGLLFSHGRYLYEQELRVPMIFWSPGRIEPSAEGGLFDHTAVKAMIERICDGDPSWIGQPPRFLVALRRVFELEEPPRPFLAAEDYSILDDRAHAVFFGGRAPQVFFGRQRRDRAEPESPEVLATLRRLGADLDEWKRQNPDSRKLSQTIPKERLDILRSLGYLN